VIDWEYTWPPSGEGECEGTSTGDSAAGSLEFYFSPIHKDQESDESVGVEMRLLNRGAPSRVSVQYKRKQYSEHYPECRALDLPKDALGGGDLSIHQLQLLEKVYFVARTSITLARQKLEAAAAAAATAADKEGIQSHVAFLDHLLNEEINLYAIMDKSAAHSLGLVHLNMFRGQANPPYDIRAKDRGEAACALVDATKEIMKGIERVSYAVLALMVVAMAFELCRDGGRRGADRSAVAGALVSAAHLVFDHKVALLVVLSTIWVSGARLRPRR